MTTTSYRFAFNAPIPPSSDRRPRHDRRPVEKAAEPESRERGVIRGAAHHPRHQSTGAGPDAEAVAAEAGRDVEIAGPAGRRDDRQDVGRGLDHAAPRSEEHTSALQSQSNLVCRLLLEKKKKKKNTQQNTTELK